MIDPRQPHTLPESGPGDGSDVESTPPARSARPRGDRGFRLAAAELAGGADSACPPPTWDQAGRALFGNGARTGLLARCRDDESLIAAALDRHPYLAAYCAYMGRDRLAFAPIHDDEHDRGRRERDRLRDEYEALAVPWGERCERGHALDVRIGELRKPNYLRVVRDRRS